MLGLRIRFLSMARTLMPTIGPLTVTGNPSRKGTVIS